MYAEVFDTNESTIRSIVENRDREWLSIIESVFGFRLASIDEATEKCTQEYQKLKQLVDDLQSGTYKNCVYCGHRYVPSINVGRTTQDLYDHSND